MPSTSPRYEGWGIDLKNAEVIPAQQLSLAAKIRRYLNSLSIRSRIFCYFLLFTALLLMLLWVFQTVLLNGFYRLQKTAALTASAEILANNVGNADLQTLVDRVSEQHDTCVLILNDNLLPIASADVSPGCLIHHMGLHELHSMADMLNQRTGKNEIRVFQMQGFRSKQYNANRFEGRVPPQDDSRNMKSMIVTRKVVLPDGQGAMIFLNALITPLNATVETLRYQLVFISAVLVLLSFLLSLVLTKRITQPIVETTLAAKELPMGRFDPASTRISYKEVAQLNAQLTQTAKDLRKVEGMQRELIANISHDLRTPLTLIEGYAEAMRDIPGESTPKNMQVIIDETKRLATLVNAVLEYGAGKNSSALQKPTVFDITASILGILQRYQKLIEQDGYQVNFVFDKHTKAFADELKVGQVVYNLINNALTYTGDDKTVTVLQTVEAGQVKIQVKDSGEGIPKEELPFIWSRYYRGSKPHKRAAIGTGLGLSIVQGILESYHWAYGVESEKTLGTTFWFTLPSADDSSS